MNRKPPPAGDTTGVSPAGLSNPEMTRRVAEFDWSQTPLGPQANWPGSLRHTVNLCLNASLPMFVWWGPDLINIHNDAYIAVLGKRHPEALGKPARQIWSDIWSLIGPDVDAVIEKGQPVVKQRVRLLMERNGYPEETFFTYSHSPILDDNGKVGGLFQVCLDETARMQAEAETQTILESISDAFFAVDRDWRFRYVNPQAERMLDRAPGDLLGKVMWEAFPGLTSSEFEKLYRGVAATRVPASLTSFYPDDQRWYEAHVYPAPDHGISIYFRDASERMQAEQARREIAERFERQSRLFEQISSSTPDFIYVFDLQGRFIYANRRLLEVWGTTAAQAIGKNVYELNYPQWHADMHMRELRQVIATKQPLRGEVPFTGGSGISGVYEYIFTPVLDPDGNVEVIAGTTRDVTDRKQAEADRETLLASERAARAEVVAAQARLISAFQGSPAFMAVMRGPQHIYEFVNDALYTLVGHRDLLGKPVSVAVPEATEQGYIDLLDRVYQTGEPFIGEYLPAAFRRTPGGPLEQRYVNFAYQPLRDADGSISGIFLHGVDTTERLKNEQQVRESEARFRQLADAMPQIVWSARADGALDYYNRRWFEFIGLKQDSRNDLISWHQYVHHDDLPRVAEAWNQSLRSGKPYRTEFRVHGKDGIYLWFLVRAEPAADASGNVVRWYGSCTDITDRKQVEEERQLLLETERAARSEAERASRMKDEFLATLSHELRTPLNAILGWSTILASGLSTAEDLRDGLDTIQRNARAQTQIIEDLLDMSRIISGKVRLEVQPADLSQILQAAIDTVRPAADAKGVRLRSVLDPHAGPVTGDPNRLQQVFWNLLTNAVKFTSRSGQVQVLLERVNSHVEVAVIDTGEGIRPEFLPHVFDRFRQADASTTRRHGGLGLGLAIVKQLVELHGGTVRVKSPGPGKGSTFTVALPLTVIHPDLEFKAPERRHPDAAGHHTDSDDCVKLTGVKVLVVDDEPDARALVKRLLSDCEAQVRVAGSVSEAMQAIACERPDVLISDIGMPGEDGYSLIRQLRAMAPPAGGDLPAVALTAYARTDDRIRAIRAGFQSHVVKPVDPIELITVVASLAGKTG